MKLGNKSVLQIYQNELTAYLQEQLLLSYDMYRFLGCIYRHIPSEFVSIMKKTPVHTTWRQKLGFGVKLIVAAEIAACLGTYIFWRKMNHNRGKLHCMVETQKLKS